MTFGAALVVLSCASIARADSKHSKRADVICFHCPHITDKLLSVFLSVKSLAKLHDLRRETVCRAEVVSPREINELFSQPHLTSFEETDVVDFIQKVTRFASLHHALLIRVAFENVTQALIIDDNASRFCRSFEDL